jgi:hypothetical protein
MESILSNTSFNRTSVEFGQSCREEISSILNALKQGQMVNYST